MNAPLRDPHSGSNDAVTWPGYGACETLLQSYSPIYEIALALQKLGSSANLRGGSSYSSSWKVDELDSAEFKAILEKIQRECPPLGLMQPTEIAKSIIGRPTPETYRELNVELTHLSKSLNRELKKEAVFRIPPERKDYFEQDKLFGLKVAAAFPSCERDIRKAGSCYALEQEDACVHHLMLVLERGLKALAVKVGVSYHHANWQVIINEIEKNLKSLPRGPDLDFHRQVNAQFGFLKEAYRNHSEHAHDDPYDMEKARSILNHVRIFMQELEKGGLTE